MELEEKYENLLIEIHDSAKERFESEYVTDQTSHGRNNLLEELNQLIKYELIEFDITDDSYYLTYEGYEKVEEIKELIETGVQMSEIEYQHLFKKSRNRHLTVIVGGIIITTLAILILYGTNQTNILK